MRTHTLIALGASLAAVPSHVVAQGGAGAQPSLATRSAPIVERDGNAVLDG